MPMARRKKRPTSIGAPSSRSSGSPPGSSSTNMVWSALADELQRSRRPGSVQLVLQSIFVREASKGRRCRMLRGGKHSQHIGPVAIGILAPRTAENAVAVFPQDLEVAIPVCAEPRRCAQLPHSPSVSPLAGLEGRRAPSSVRLVRPRLSKKSTREEACQILCGLVTSDRGTRGRGYPSSFQQRALGSMRSDKVASLQPRRHLPYVCQLSPHWLALAGIAPLFTRKLHAAVIRACNAMIRKD